MGLNVIYALHFVILRATDVRVFAVGAGGWRDRILGHYVGQN